jgi:hypothetical protein
MTPLTPTSWWRRWRPTATESSVAPTPPGRLVWVMRGALIFFGLLSPLLLFELALRLAGPILPGEYQTAAFTASSSAVGRQNRPNTAGWKHTAEFTTWVRVNSKGLRGPEIPYVKPTGTYRVLVLGDSFTFALQVAEEETFVARLAEQLNASGSGDRWLEHHQRAGLVSTGGLPLRAGPGAADVLRGQRPRR